MALFEVKKINPAVMLRDRFIVPPFSYLDTRQSYWIERRGRWKKFIGDLSATRDGDFGTLGGSTGNLLSTINNGTSNFDPVLAEIIYKWFCMDNSKILDPFGGEQTKGYVAGALGYKYVGCEIRPEQVELNTNTVSDFNDIRYVCGDSNEISNLISDRDFNFCFTSPPYYDLEIYSDSDGDISAFGTYENFINTLKNIFSQCYDMLQDDSFCVVKVADIRDKKTGIYRGFVADTIKFMQDIGFNFYNDIVLLNSVGTGAIRANNSMKNRKVVKLHQNILVFYKGDVKNIKDKFPSLDFKEVLV